MSNLLSISFKILGLLVRLFEVYIYKCTYFRDEVRGIKAKERGFVV